MNDHCKGCPGKNEEVWDCGECGLEKNKKEAVEMTEIMEMWQVERAHRGHWFEPQAKRFFNSRVAQTASVKDGKAYFTSSEQFDYNSPRLYSVRVCDLVTGDIDTVGEFQQYETASRANRAVKELVS